MSILEVNNINKIYSTKLDKFKVQALKDVSFSIERGEYVAIMGESGSGKSTLLNILASLDNPSSGSVFLEGENISQIPDDRLASFRRNNLGFVFQDFNLLDNFTIKDNIILPLVLSQTPIKEIEARLYPLVKSLAIEDLLNKYPFELSGGQKQRTAISRALITNPKIVFADEPTGALDSKTSQQLLELFQKINEEGQTILTVTHSTVAASHSKRVIFIKDGSLYHQLYKGSRSNEDFYEEIAETLTVLATRGGDNE